MFKNTRMLMVLSSALVFAFSASVISSLLGAELSSFNFGLVTLMVLGLLIGRVFVDYSVTQKQDPATDTFLKIIVTAIITAVLIQSLNALSTGLVEAGIWTALAVPAFMYQLMVLVQLSAYWVERNRVRRAEQKQQKRMDAHEAWLKHVSLKFDAWEYQHDLKKKHRSSD